MTRMVLWSSGRVQRALQSLRSHFGSMQLVERFLDVVLKTLHNMLGDLGYQE